MSKLIIVTGATGNLGSAVCRTLAEAGYEVIGTTLPDAHEKSAHATLVPLDLIDENQVEEAIEQIKTNRQSIHALICLAGGFAMGNLESMKSDDLLKMYRLNFLTAYHIVRPVYQWMSTQGSGRIVLTGAKPAVEGGGFEVLPYALSKGSVIQLADIINEKSNDSGVVASVIVPSIIDTPPNREAMPDADFSNWVKPETIARQILHLINEDSMALRNPLLRIYGMS